MSVAFVTTASGIGRVMDAEVEVLDLPYPDLGALLRARGSFAEALTAPVRERRPLLSLALLAPLRPGSTWGIGLNYRSKATLTGRPISAEPILFLKAASALAHPGQDVVIPQGVARFDYEGEIAIIIGRRAAAIEAADAWSHIAGLTAANDTTARDIMKATGNPSLAKSYAASAPLGASVVPLEGAPDLGALTITTHVNGDLRQQDDATGLIFSIPELIARLSRHAALEPGDIVLTGTPAGTGEDRDQPLRPGDQVTITVAGVLPLQNRFVAAQGR